MFQGWCEQPCNTRDLLLQPMNLLSVGDSDLLEHCTGHFLLLDDGPLIDTYKRRTKHKFTELNFHKHSFNPLSRMSYQKRRDLIDIIDATFSIDSTTLTKDSGLAFIRRNLSKTRYLQHLIPAPDSKSSPGHIWAYDKISEILESPVLEHVFCGTPNFSMRGTILARLDRADLGDFDCRLLGRLLIAQYNGQVIIPDFRFYGIESHVSLIRQKRLIAGVRYLDTSPLKDDLLLIKDRIGQHCLHEDAETLAQLKGLIPGTVDYGAEVLTLMGV